MAETVTRSIDLREQWRAFRSGAELADVAQQIRAKVETALEGAVPPDIEAALEDLVTAAKRDSISEFRREAAWLRAEARRAGITIALEG